MLRVQVVLLLIFQVIMVVMELIQYFQQLQLQVEEVEWQDLVHLKMVYQEVLVVEHLEDHLVVELVDQVIHLLQLHLKEIMAEIQILLLQEQVAVEQVGQELLQSQDQEEQLQVEQV